MGEYDDEVARYCVTVPERYNVVVDDLAWWAADEPEALALVVVDEDGLECARLTIGEVVAGSTATARQLVAQGVGKGHLVALDGPRDVTWTFMLLAAMRIGAVPVALPSALSLDTAASLLGRLQPHVMLANDRLASIVDSLQEDLPHRLLALTDDERRADARGWKLVGPNASESTNVPLPEDPTASDDPMLVVTTRGTTGPRRLVLHRHSWPLGHAAAVRYWLDLRPGDIHLLLDSSAHWLSPATSLLGVWQQRAAVVQTTGPLSNPAATLALIERHRVTSMCATPRVYWRLSQTAARVNLSRLRHCTAVGAQVDRTVAAAWRERSDGLTIHRGYGQAETSVIIGNFRSIADRKDTIGKCMPGWHVEVVDDRGVVVPAGVNGRLVVRTDSGPPPGLFAGYMGDPLATSAAFAGGWYDTGDRARIDSEGYVTLVGRGPRPNAAGDAFDSGLHALLRPSTT